MNQLKGTTLIENLYMTTHTASAITTGLTSKWESLTTLANSKDVPYQSLIKIFLDEKIRQELRR